MSQEDLYTALNMLGSGVRQLQLSRTIQGANDQVQQIRATEASDADKRTALTNLSHDLVARMGAIGAPLDQIQAQAGAVAPPTLGSGMDMYRQGLLTNNSGLQQMGLTAQKQEEQPAMDKERMQLAAMAPFRQAMFAEKQNTETQKLLDDAGKYANASAQSSRSSFGQMGVGLAKANQVQAFMGDPNKWNQANSADATLTVEGLSNLVKNGVATKEEMQAMVPGTSGTWESRLQSFFTNKPEPAQIQGFMQKYNDIINRESAERQYQVQNEILNRYTERMGVAKRPGAESNFKVNVANQLTTYGLPTRPEDVMLDPKNGVTTTQMQQLQGAQDQASQGMRWSYSTLASKTASPQDQAKAQQFLQMYGLSDPGSIPVSQAVERAKKQTRIRMLQ